MTKGAIFTTEHKRNLSIARRKRITTSETRAKMSITQKAVLNNSGRFQKGMVTWNKGVKQWEDKVHPQLGKTHTEETKKHLAETSRGNSNAKGYKHTIEFRKQSSERGKNRPKEFYQKMGAISTAKQSHRNEPTSIEKKVYQELKDRGLLFETQKIINNKFVVDAYIPSLNLVIECDGDYWHSLEENKKRDKAKNAYLAACGYSLIRLTETEINNGQYVNKMKEVN